MAKQLDARDSLAKLAASRHALLRVVADLDDDALRAQFHPEFSPIGWHLGHVVFQEECFLLRRLGQRAPLFSELDGVFDSFRSEKSSRSGRLPEKSFLLAYAERVRGEVARLLAERGGEPEAALLARMIANHELQHTEIVVSVRLLGELYLDGASLAGPASSANAPTPGAPWIPVSGGTFPLGTSDDPDAADNERPAHLVSVDDFAFARFPVTEHEWLAWMASGGYEEPKLWSNAGWAFRSEKGICAPAHWERERDGSYVRRTLVGKRPVGENRPVCHVSFHEAEAFACFAGARLPTEVEWEYAASWDARRREKRRYPWGNELARERADLGLVGGAPAPCGGHPRGRSPDGLEDLCGGVWEWVSSQFEPYPGFSPGPYAGYSAPWFGSEHRVARGGSFATAAENARTTFRNWYALHLREPCLGLRLARRDG